MQLRNSWASNWLCPMNIGLGLGCGLGLGLLGVVLVVPYEHRSELCDYALDVGGGYDRTFERAICTLPYLVGLGSN